LLYLYLFITQQPKRLQINLVGNGWAILRDKVNF